MGRHCQKCHYEESDVRFRQKNPKNRATTKHVCPKNAKKKHSFAECPAQYEAGHKTELDEIKKKQVALRKAQEDEQKEAKKAEQAQKKGARTQASQEKQAKTQKTKKLKDRRLATKLPEFKRFLRECGIVAEASPNYLDQLLQCLRRYVFELNASKEDNERKRKRADTKPWTFDQVVEAIYNSEDEYPPSKRQRIVDESSSEENEEVLLSNNNRDGFIPTVQPPDPDATNLDFCTAESADSDEEKSLEEVQTIAGPNNNNNNYPNDDDEENYIPPFMYEDQQHFDGSTTFVCDDLDPGQLLALRSYIQSLRNENK